MLARPESCLLLVIDVQPAFLNPIYRAADVLLRCDFLLRCASRLGISCAATEQYPVRMGGSEALLAGLLTEAKAPIFAKMTFSAVGCAPFDHFLAELNPKQVILVGIETHICVNQTAHDLVAQGREVIVVGDAVSARSAEMHHLGLERMRDASVTIAHSESVVYEWMHSAENDAFRDVLRIVKSSVE